jgi:K+-sensing histidine kinase KdpD
MWPAALLAAAVFAVVNLVSTAIPLAVVEGRSVADMVRSTGTPAMLSAAVAAPSGLVVSELVELSPFAPLVLLPLAAALVANARAAAAGRAEHQLVERLYAAMHDTSRLRGADDAARAVADRALELLVATGVAVLWRDREERWQAVAVGDAVAADAVAAGNALVDHLGTDTAAVVSSDVAIGGSGALLAARASSVVEVVVAVRRRVDVGETITPALDTIAALAAQAALVLHNSALLGEVERALAQQVVLNRHKGEFVAMVSHELRTPLAAMVGFAETVHEHVEVMEVARVRDYLGRSLEQGQRLQRLIDELLAVAAAEHASMTVRPRVVEVQSIVEDARRCVAAFAGGRLLVAAFEGALTVMTDRDKAARIIVNLVENAVKYSDGVVRVSAAEVADRICLAVDDEGDGIPVGQEAAVFEPFVQLDQSTTRVKGGAGLGLHLCRQMATALGGSVDYERSTLGGARFSLWLPRAGAGVATPLLESGASATDP